MSVHLSFGFLPHMKKMELSFSPAIALMFIGAIGISVIIGIFIYFSYKSLDEANWWRNHTYDVIHATSQLKSDLSDLESDTRGYVLALDNHFLKTYDPRSLLISHDYSRLKELTRDGKNKNVNPVQLENLLSHRLFILNSLVKIAQSNYSSAEAKNKKTTSLIREGSLIRSVLNAQLANIEAEEMHLLTRRTLQLHKVDEQTR